MCVCVCVCVCECVWLCVWVLSNPPPFLSGTPRRSSMQMLIRNWCIAGGFKVMTSQGGTFTIKYGNAHRQCSFCSTMCLEMHLQAKIVCHTTRINCWNKQTRMLKIHQSRFWRGTFSELLHYASDFKKALSTFLWTGHDLWLSVSFVGNRIWKHHFVLLPFITWVDSHKTEDMQQFKLYSVLQPCNALIIMYPQVDYSITFHHHVRQFMHVCMMDVWQFAVASVKNKKS